MWALCINGTQIASTVYSQAICKKSNRIQNTITLRPSWLITQQAPLWVECKALVSNVFEFVYDLKLHQQQSATNVDRVYCEGKLPASKRMWMMVNCWICDAQSGAKLKCVHEAPQVDTRFHRPRCNLKTDCNCHSIWYWSWPASFRLRNPHKFWHAGKGQKALSFIILEAI